MPQPVYDLSTAQLGLLCVSPIDGLLSYVLDPAVAGEVVATLPDDDACDFQDDSSFQSVLGMIPAQASFRWSSPSLLGHVPSTGEYKALRTNGYCTGRDGGLFGQERITPAKSTSQKQIRLLNGSMVSSGHGHRQRDLDEKMFD